MKEFSPRQLTIRAKKRLSKDKDTNALIRNIDMIKSARTKKGNTESVLSEVIVLKEISHKIIDRL